MKLAAILALVLFALPPQTDPPADPFVRVELANGVRAAILHAEEAQRQSFLVFLPRGLYHDGANRAQFSHLLEHMLIRSTDPDSLTPKGMELNGETMGGSLRLDVYAEPDHWRKALIRTRRWITAEEFDADVLDTEIDRIAGEFAGTVPQGYTHKWAMAGWSQVAGHELEHAAVVGDVERATVEEVAAYAEQRVRVGEDLWIVCAGPTPVAELTTALEEEFGALKAQRRSKRTRLANKTLATGDLTATWDVAARHYIEWYPLPAKTARDRVAGYALSRRLLQILFQAEDRQLKGGKALAAYDLETRGGRGLTISVSLDATTDVIEVQAALRKLLDGILDSNRRQPEVEATILQLQMQLGRVPAMGFLSGAMGGGSPLAEAQIALNLANQELQMGLTSPEVVAALDALKPEHVEAMAKKHLALENRSSLLLEPATDGE